MLEKLKKEFNFVKDAIPKVTKAYAKRLIGDTPSSSVQNFRKSQCESCALFNGSNCDKTILVNENSSGYEQVYLAHIEKSSSYSLIQINGIIRKAIAPNGKIFHRGCGCPLVGSSAKWKLSFEDKELENKDGSGPCPMGKWNKENYNKWLSNDGSTIKKD